MIRIVLVAVLGLGLLAATPTAAIAAPTPYSAPSVPANGLAEAPESSTNVAQALAQAAATQTPAQAVSAAAAHAAASGTTAFISVRDRSTGAILAQTGNADSQVGSESIFKLFLAAYYLRLYGGYANAPGSVTDQLSYMIRYSDDATADSLYTDNAVPTMASVYGLTETSNSTDRSGHWGASRITAHDMSQFLYDASQDSEVGPWLFPVMAQVNALGSDGFDQHFGFNALSGTHGSKQGWGCDSYFTAQTCAIHSVGYTDSYVAAVLQLAGSSGFPDPMRSNATYAAQLIQASGTVPAPAPAPVHAPGLPAAKATTIVIHLYQGTLGRNPDASGLHAYVGALTSGAASVTGVAGALADSGEATAHLVNSAYRQCVGRNADPGGSAAYSHALHAGATWSSVIAALCGSGEAWNRAGQNLGTWAINVYGGILGRVPSTNGRLVLANLAAHNGRGAAAVWLLDSIESETRLLNGVYLSMLRRNADPSGIATFDRFMPTRGLFTVSVSIAGSAEFQNRP